MHHFLLKALAETGVPQIQTLYIYIVGTKQTMQAMAGGGTEVM